MTTATELRTIIPLLTITRGFTTLRLTAWPLAVRIHDTLYRPYPFQLEISPEAEPLGNVQIELHILHEDLWAAPFPGEGPIMATVLFVPSDDPSSILTTLHGTIEFDGDRIMFCPADPPHA